MLGTRGVPANYSGFETCVEQLGQRLVKRGHDVTVYCRSSYIEYDEPFYKGMRLLKFPTIRNKYLDTIVHSTITSIHALTQGYDIGLYFIVGNSPVTWLPRIAGTKTILNVDGLDWKREKWPEPAKKYLRFCEYLSTILPNRFLTDSRKVVDYYETEYGVCPPYIAYGSDVKHLPPGQILKKFNLKPQEYVLFVGRLVPENCVDHLIEGFKKAKEATDTHFKCVIVGDAAYSDKTIHSLKKLAGNDDSIIFTGYQFGDAYHELGTNAAIFVESSAVGGTHPALIEAMAHGSCVIVNDTAENLETIGTNGFSYDGKLGGIALAEKLIQLFESPDLISTYQTHALHHADITYSWDTITDEYERLMESLLKRPIPNQATLSVQ